MAQFDAQSFHSQLSLVHEPTPHTRLEGRVAVISGGSGCVGGGIIRKCAGGRQRTSFDRQDQRHAAGAADALLASLLPAAACRWLKEGATIIAPVRTEEGKDSECHGARD